MHLFFHFSFLLYNFFFFISLHINIYKVTIIIIIIIFAKLKEMEPDFVSLFKITRNCFAGLSVSCETVMDAEMFVEMPATTSLVDSEIEYKVQLDETSDTAIVQYLVPDVGLEELSLSLKSSCGEDCNIVVYVTAEDNLADGLLNSTAMSLSFKPYVDNFHFVTLRLLSGNASNVTMQLPMNHQTDIGVDQVTPVVLSRKSFPEFFLFDYEHLLGNDTKPQPFNVTAETLSVLSFEIGRVYDVGGTVTLGFKLIDVEEKYKKNIVLVACVSLGRFLCLKVPLISFRIKIENSILSSTSSLKINLSVTLM